MKNLLYLSSVLLLISCQTEKATTNFSKTNIYEKPIKNVDVLLQVQTVDSERGDTIFLANETRIIIPKNSFVDSLGNRIKGKVKINYQEYHSEADLILSGIPMLYDSAGVEYTFETDGMFKISAEYKGTNVKIAPDKKINIKTKSYKEDTPCFNYYTQDKKGKWSYNQTKERELDIDKTIKIITSKIKTINENSVAIEFSTSLNQYPELANITWMYNGSKPDTLDLKSMSKIKWENFTLQKTNESVYSYDLIGKHKKKRFRLPITPAFSENELKEIRKQTKTRAIEQAKKIAESLKQYKREVDIVQFGTHNWDRIAREEVILVNTTINSVKKIKYYYVVNKSSEYKMVNKYFPNKYENKFNITKNGTSCIIAFLEEGNIAYANGNQIKETIKNGLPLELIESTKTITNSSDLQKIIDQI